MLKYFLEKSVIKQKVVVEDIINEGKKISNYAHFTHASSFAQQCPISTAYFYDIILMNVYQRWQCGFLCYISWR